MWPAVIKAHISLELPFMATEVILMQCVVAGGDRQLLHERIREHSMASGRRVSHHLHSFYHSTRFFDTNNPIFIIVDCVDQVKEEGASNDLLERIAQDEAFAAVHDELDQLLDPAVTTSY